MLKMFINSTVLPLPLGKMLKMFINSTILHLPLGKMLRMFRNFTIFNGLHKCIPLKKVKFINIFDKAAETKNLKSDCEYNKVYVFFTAIIFTEVN